MDLRHKLSGVGLPEGAPKKEECSDAFWHFLQRVFERDPKKRATCEELLDCDWLQVDASEPHAYLCNATREGTCPYCHRGENGKENHLNMDKNNIYDWNMVGRHLYINGGTVEVDGTLLGS